jgi:hypothetical protein
MPEIGRTRKFEEKQRTGTTESALNFRDRPVPVTQDGFFARRVSDRSAMSADAPANPAQHSNND